MSVAACLSLLTARVGTASGPNDEPGAVKRVAALPISEPITVDGRLDEVAWSRAEAARDFHQQQPDEGALSTEQSEVRFLYDAHVLYVGGTFFDSEPDRAITSELKWDFAARDGDLITVVLDTFHDRRNSFSFMINPAGAQRDAQSYDDGRQINTNWDGVWHVKTSRFDRGWTMEMAIPFKTLRFPDHGEQIWGLNILRLIRRKNELTVWSPVPRQFNQFKVSYGGVLTGIRQVKPSLNLRVKPFLTLLPVTPTSAAASTDRVNGGLDLKYGVRSALTLDLSYRTDFSQVEADEQQINLTRFSLFLPEKRDFFLENQGSYRIGDVDQRAAVRTPIIPFFSRRIGLGPDGTLVPILAGARLTGRQGGYSLGVLNMQTRPGEDRDADNFTALRISRDLGTAGAVSAFYFGRQSGGADPFNRVIGGDVHLALRRTTDLDGFLMRSSTSDAATGLAGRAALNVRENRYTAHLSYTHISPTFRNDLGFIPRGDIGLLSWELTGHLRPRASYRWVRTYSLGTQGDVFESAHTELLTRSVRVNALAELADGGKLGVDVESQYELLSQPFEIARGVVVPAGVYRFQQIVPSYTSDPSRALSGGATATIGEFWSGSIRGMEGSLRVRVNERLAASAAMAVNRVTLPEGRFSADIARFRVDYSFSTRMFLNAFIQYNGASKAWISNVRYRFIYKPLSDMYLVFNEIRDPRRGTDRAIVAKYTILLAF